MTKEQYVKQQIKNYCKLMKSQQRIPNIVEIRKLIQQWKLDYELDMYVK